MANNVKADNKDKLSEPVGKGEGIVGSAADYAAYVNFGHRTRGNTFVDAQPFLSTAGEIVAQSLKKTITAEQQIAMYKEISSSFTKSIKDGVEIIKYGNPFDGVELGNDTAILKAVVEITSRAKGLQQPAEVNGGYLRNSIMWRTYKEPKGGGFNEG